MWGGDHDVSGGSLQVTALPLELIYSFHMELLLHPARTRRLRSDTTFSSDEAAFTEVSETRATRYERGIKPKQLRVAATSRQHGVL